MLILNAQEIAKLLVESAKTAELFVIAPKVRCLAFQLKGSASAEEATKVAEAYQNAQELALIIEIDGELPIWCGTYVASVAKTKSPDS